jgi:hypothetical protein
MAKNFKYKAQFNSYCEDYCTCTTNPTHGKHTKIGSVKCQQCNHHIRSNVLMDTISCPKIIYRHANGTVIIRKK